MLRRGKEWVGLKNKQNKRKQNKTQGLNGCSVLGHSQTDHRSVLFVRGQVLPADSLLNIVDVELIYGGVKYILKVRAPTHWGLEGIVFL